MFLDGTEYGDQRWHSYAAAARFFPTMVRGRFLSAGNHTIKIRGDNDPGSGAAVDYVTPRITVTGRM
jgi:hypothetical protein